MTKSQNTTGEQQTEQWKKGQLECFRWYYIKFKTGEIDICWLTQWNNDELGTGGQYFDGIKQENILEVLAPVPSYEEYQKLLSDQLAKNEGVEINAELEAENAKLKELLKECKPYIALYIDNNKHFGFTPETANLLQRIKEVLK